MHDLPTITDLVDAGALFACSHSGGKDSQAMAIRLRQLVPADQLVFIHANLGDVEHAGVIDHIHDTLLPGEHLDIVVSHWGLHDLIRDRRAKLDAQGKADTPHFPDAQRYCTSTLKRDPIEKRLKQLVKEHSTRTRSAPGWAGRRVHIKSLVVDCQGLRIQESGTRGKRLGAVVSHNPHGEYLKENNRLRAPTLGRRGFLYYPLAELSADEVFDIIREAGQEPHPMYAAGNDRLSCAFCIFGSKNDLRNAARAYPDLARRTIALETETGFTMAPDRIPLIDKIGDLL